MSEFDRMAPWGGLRRCIVNQDHSVVYYLDPDDSNYKEDGTLVDWQEVETEVQNVMVEIPKFYYIKKKVDDTFYFGVTAKPLDNEYVSSNEWLVHPAFFRDRTKLCDDNSAIPMEVDNRYMGAFYGWKDSSNRLRSLPNKKPTVNTTIGNFRTYSKNMGNGWCQFDYYLMYAIQMLYITEFGHPDSQTMIGRGYVDGNSASASTGGTLSKGNNTFGETTGKVQMSYRGIEDLWGNVYNFVDGFFFDASGNILVNNKGFNDTGSRYKNVGKENSTVSLGNIRNIQNDIDAGFLPRITSGSNHDEGLYDRGSLNVYSGGQVADYGGGWTNASLAGIFRFYANYTASYSYANRSARLCL